MNEPLLHHVACMRPTGLHRMAYWEWACTGAAGAGAPVLVCAHGLSRQGRDFDTLARDLASHWRVISVDVLGRGQSEWLTDPMGYTVPHYVADMVTLIARLNVAQVDWVGTSMGGLIGMGLASLPSRPTSLVRKLVLNDVGPAIQPAALVRIGSYLGQPAFFESLDEAADALWAISQGFGPHSREDWLALTRPQLVPHTQDGVQGFKPHYDPAIALPFKAVTPELAAAGEAALWQAYDRIAAPTLLIRGAQSDLLSLETARAMAERGPKARLVELPGVGHAPTLVAADQRRYVREFLLGP